MEFDLPFWKNASPKRKRIYSTVFIFIITIVTTLSGMLVQLSPSDAKMITDQVNQTTTQYTGVALAEHIFINNFGICLAMFIPLAGAAIGLFILFDTGIAFRAIFDTQAASGFSSSAAAASGIDASTAFLLLGFVGLTFLLEYVSYSIGITESIWLFRRITQKRWREVKNTAILIGVVAVLLTVGAIVETYALALGA
jgi:hypothetical protein